MAAAAFCTKIEGARFPNTTLIYVNGINTTEAKAVATARSIKYAFNCTVFSCYNSCTSPSKILEVIATGAITSSKLLEEYRDIQACKEESAANIVAEIRGILSAPEKKVVLLGHGQGAHIVQEVFISLPHTYKPRVAPIALGGIVEILGDNFLFKGDLLAQRVQKFYGGRGFWNLEGGSHSIDDYLKDQNVLATIRTRLAHG